MLFSFVGAIIVFAVHWQTCRAVSCKNFTVYAYDGSEDTFTQPALDTIIASKGVVCQSSSIPCSVSIEGYVTDGRTLNITVDDSTASSLFDLISATIKIPFNQTVTSSLDHISGWPVNTTGYVGFTPNHRCTRGILGQCSSNDLEGIAVEACTPYSNSPGGGISGTYHTVSTSVQEAQTLTCNPANTTAAKNGQNPSNCSGATQGDGHTSDAGAATGMGFFLLLVCLMVTMLEIV